MAAKSRSKRRIRRFPKKTAEFHGHRSLLLVIDVRTGFSGLRELELKKSTEKLHVTALLKYSVPVSCVLDGIQVTTGYTFGNKKLTSKNASGIAAEFRLPDRKRVTVAVNQTFFNRLKKKLVSEKVSNHEMQDLVRLVASTPEEDSFVIEREQRFS